MSISNSPAPPPVPSPDPNAPVVTLQLSRMQYYSLLGVAITIIAGLLGLIYTTIISDLGEAKQDIKELAKSFEKNIESSIRVQDLLAKSPRLEESVQQTRDAVVKIQSRVEIIDSKIDLNQNQINNRLDNLQKQVHSIPGVPN